MILLGYLVLGAMCAFVFLLTKKSAGGRPAQVIVRPSQ